MLAPDQALSELSLPALDVRALARRAAVPALLAAAAGTAAWLAAGRTRALAAPLRRILHLDPGWALLGVALECLSLAGYIVLLWLVAGRAAPRIGHRESAQLTLAGAAATRLLPTAGAGGAALTAWSLRRAGLTPDAAARTLLAFLVVLYSVFLASIVIAGATLSLGLVPRRGPLALSALAAVAAAAAIALALGLSRSRGAARPEPRSRVRASADLLGHAVGDARAILRGGDWRLAGAVAYWVCDAAVLWAMLEALGAAPALPVVALAYFVGQAANTLPLPGSVSGGIAGVLVAFGVPAGLALPAVLAYRTVAVWLPTPAALAAVPRLRATVARWSREDA
jgi:uncharacterized membrane protein YbhN (UPF0104 family)